MIDQQTKDEIWLALASDNHVMLLVQDINQLPEVTKELFDFLRPCGVESECSDAIQLANNKWLFCKPMVHAAPVNRLFNVKVFVL